MEGKKGFQSGHKDRIQRKYDRELCKRPYSFKPFSDQIEAMKDIDDLAGKLREYIDELISGQNSSNG